ncbi:MAG TPA: hypothetical protein VFY04_04000 [Solirubrobacterales bacterium]|nr:hypothetical protein [Solirubrobacterales bacterium]
MRGDPLSVMPADIAAAERWLARVWPAIALGGVVSGGLPTDGAAAALLRPAIVVVAQLISLPSSRASLASNPAGDLSSPRTSVPASGAKPTVPDPSTAADWKKTLYTVVLVALLALLALTIWKEMWPVLRANLR